MLPSVQAAVVAPLLTRKSSISPTPPVAGYSLWYEANAIGAADGVGVATWADAGALAKNLTQATAGLQPVVKKSQVNGRDVVRFDGVDDFLATATDFTLAQANTFFIVLKHLRTSATPEAWFDGGSGAVRELFNKENATTVRLYCDVALDYTAEVFPHTAFHLFTALANGASSTVRKDGAQISAGAAGAAGLNGLLLGKRVTNDGFANVDIAEFLAFNSALSAANRDSVETWLNSKYALF